jgi:hypothetical protein
VVAALRERFRHNLRATLALEHGMRAGGAAR